MNKRYLMVCGLLLWVQSISAATVGSNTGVSVSSFVTFPNNQVNSILGFVAMNSGFALANLQSSVNYNAFFPVSSLFSLNGGVVSMSQDLVFSQNIDVQSPGTILGNGTSLQILNDGPLILPSGSAPGGDSYSFVTALGNKSSVQTVDWSFDNLYVAAGLTNGEVRIYYFDGSSLKLVFTISSKKASVLSVRWHPKLYLLAVGANAGSNKELFIYRFDSNTAQEVSSFSLDQVGGVSWSPSGKYLAALTNSKSGSTLYVYSVDSDGNASLVDSYQVSNSLNTSQNVIAWDPTSSYIAVGMQEEDVSEELQVYSFDGSGIELNATSRIGAYVITLDWHHSQQVIAVGLDSKVDQTLRVYSFEPGALTNQPSAYTDTNNVATQLAWAYNGNYLATTGAIADKMNNIYDYSQDNITLKLQYNISLEADGYDIRWSPSSEFVVYGDSNGTITIYRLASIPIVDKFTISNLKLTFYSDVILNKGILFQGVCMIDGKNNSFDMTNGFFLIDTGATLLLKDVTLNNIAIANIQAVDSSGILQLRNVQWAQTNNFYWQQGKIVISGNTLLRGNGSKFSYQSNQQSVILSNSTWFIDTGVTFEYGPSAAQNLIVFSDQSSIWYFNEASLSANAIGMQLKKGTLVFAGKCQIVSQGINQSTGITFGDGVTVANDVNLKFLPGSELTSSMGYVSYNNVA